ncbi:hypothetical protein TWF281_005302 [Arthrobotrys megalospora]
MYRLNLAAFAKLKHRRIVDTDDTTGTTPPRIPDIRVTLPTEIQVEIISYLSINDQISCSLVCKLWESLVVHSQTLAQSRYTSPVITSTGFQIPATHKIFDLEGWLTCTFKGSITQFRIFDPTRRQRRNIGQEIVSGPVASNRIFNLDISSSLILDEPFFSPFNPPEEYDEIAAILDSDDVRLHLNRDQHAYGVYDPYRLQRTSSHTHVRPNPWAHSRAAIFQDSETEFYDLELKRRMLNRVSVELFRQLPVDKESTVGAVHPWLPDRNVTVRQVMEQVLGLGFAKHSFRSLGLRVGVEYEVRFWNSYFPENDETVYGAHDGQEYGAQDQRQTGLRRWWPTAIFHQ